MSVIFLINWGIFFYLFIFGIQPLDDSTVISVHSKDFQKGKRESTVNLLAF